MEAIKITKYYFDHQFRKGGAPRPTSLMSSSLTEDGNTLGLCPVPNDASRKHLFLLHHPLDLRSSNGKSINTSITYKHFASIYDPHISNVIWYPSESWQGYKDTGLRTGHGRTASKSSFSLNAVSKWHHNATSKVELKNLASSPLSHAICYIYTRLSGTTLGIHYPALRLLQW